MVDGCSTGTLASKEEDAAAKTFKTHPAKANLYLFRPGLIGSMGPWDVSLNGRSVANVYARNYVLVSLDPGMYTLSRPGWGGELRLAVEADKNYFIAYRIGLAMILERVADDEGMRAVREMPRGTTFF
jgi:hypothetical protein